MKNIFKKIVCHKDLANVHLTSCLKNKDSIWSFSELEKAKLQL